MPKKEVSCGARNQQVGWAVQIIPSKTVPKTILSVIPAPLSGKVTGEMGVMVKR
jgi:hypothetical protein